MNGKPPVEALRLYTPTELLDFPEPSFLLEPFIPERALVVLFGASNTFKTFCALDMSARVDGLAIYISAEGSPKRFGQRIAAWEQVAERPAGILCHPFAISLLEDGGERLAATFRALDEPVRLVVIDTIARNTAGSDENSAQDTGRLVGVLDRLRAEFGCAILAVHHTGHGNSDRERGSSALGGAADVRICARRAEGKQLETRLECARMRDAVEFEPRLVRLMPVADSLVVVEAITRPDALERAVAEHLSEHPEASQREVERAVTGGTDEIRAAYRRMRQTRQTGGGAPRAGCAPGGRP